MDEALVRDNEDEVLALVLVALRAGLVAVVGELVPNSKLFFFFFSARAFLLCSSNTLSAFTPTRASGKFIPHCFLFLVLFFFLE